MGSRAKFLHLKDFHHHRRHRQIDLLRLRDFHIDEHRRQVNQLQAMIADFERLAAQLELEIQAEEDRTKINDPSHVAYSTLAKATIVRRENVRPVQLLLPRRTQDVGSNLWSTYNVIQENVVRGGIASFGPNAHGQLRHGRTRAINGIDQDLKLNKALWILAQSWADHAKAATV